MADKGKEKKEDQPGWGKWISQASLEAVSFIGSSASRHITKKQDATKSNYSNYQFSDSGAVLDPRAKPKTTKQSSEANINREKEKECYKCGQTFGLACYRYTCASCFHDFCDKDLPFQDYIPTDVDDEMLLERVCEWCHKEISVNARTRRVAWRLMRIQCYFERSLIPISYVLEDTAKRKAIRAMVLTVKAAKHLPIGWSINAAATFVDLMIRHGGVTFEMMMSSSQLTEAVASIMSAAGSPTNVDLRTVITSFYYLLALRRWERGISLGAECAANRAKEDIATDAELREYLYYSTFAAYFAYMEDPLDLQRVLAQQGYALLFAELKSKGIELPAYFLAASFRRQEAILAIRGTSCVHDFGTDINATPIPFPHEDSTTIAHGGMARAVRDIYAEVVESLRAFKEKGFKITLCGHSLGASCSALLACLLKEEFPEIQSFGFGSPSCVDLKLAESMRSYAKVLVNKDDVVPRLSVPRSRSLLQTLVEYEEVWKPLFAEDKASATERVKNVWNPNFRNTSSSIIADAGYMIPDPEEKLKEEEHRARVVLEAEMEQQEEKERVKEQIKEAVKETMTGEPGKVESGAAGRPEVPKSGWPTDPEAIHEALKLRPSPISGSNVELQVEQELSPALYVPGSIVHIMQTGDGLLEAFHVSATHELMDSLVIQTNVSSMNVPWDCKNLFVEKSISILSISYS